MLVILENFFTKGTHPQKFCTLKISQYTVCRAGITTYVGYLLPKIIFITLTLQVTWFFITLWIQNMKDCGHTHIQKDYPWPHTNSHVFIYRLKDSSLNKLSNDLQYYIYVFYGGELTCHEATDPLVCFNWHALSVSLLQHRHFLHHVIYIKNWLTITNKMASRVLIYELGSPSYVWQFKAWKVEKPYKVAIFKPSLWRTGFFGCGEEWYHFWQELIIMVPG